MSLAQGNNTPTRLRIEPGSHDPESDALTTRPVRPLWKSADVQSELPRPIKIGLGYGCGVELCTKITAFCSPEMRKKNSSLPRVVTTIKIDISGFPKYSVNGSNNVYLFS